MARRMLVAGNWKLYKTISEAIELAGQLRSALAHVDYCDLVVAPVYPALFPVAQKLAGSQIAVAAQEIFFEDEGAFTGAVSAPHVKAAGCSYTIVGHSERRQYFAETLETSRRRVAAALKAQLKPIVCVGETLSEREAGDTERVVLEQLDAALEGLSVSALAQVVIAYEPVWAIGTGHVATPAQAQEVHALIRDRLRRKDAAVAGAMRILYGGSVKPDNAAELMGQADIDGALVGGASLKSDSFASIVQACKR